MCTNPKEQIYKANSPDKLMGLEHSVTLKESIERAETRFNQFD